MPTSPPHEAGRLNPLDAARLRQALELAAGVIGLTDPNPRVGCVIGRPDGTVLAMGATQAAGGPHAEAVALAEARRLGLNLTGATAWVTLEPCAHHGRTPPCCDALVEAGIARVVAALEDPFPAVSGRGLARLRAAGVEVTVAAGDIAREARDINIGFLSRVLRGRPWCRIKSACSLDGRTALPNGRSQWITGTEARRDAHAWRRRASVVLTGVGTVLADDPQMDVRLVETPRQPQRAILDSRLRTPAEARLLDRPGTLIYHAAMDMAEPGTAGRAHALVSRGASLVAIEATPSTASPGLPLERVLADLTRRQTNELHVEAGAALTGSWIDAGCADELLVYMAPLLLGAGAPIARTGDLTSVPEGRGWRWLDTQPVGEDLRLRLVAQASDPDRWCPIPP